MNCNRPLDPSARRAVGGGNRLRASPSAASRPQQKKRTIHVLQNRTSLKTRDTRRLFRLIILAGDLGATYKLHSVSSKVIIEST